MPRFLRRGLFRFGVEDQNVRHTAEGVTVDRAYAGAFARQWRLIFEEQ